MTKFNSLLIGFLSITIIVFSCKKESSVDPNNPIPIDSTIITPSSSIGSFIVMVLTRTPTTDTFKWTKPTVTGDSTLKFKIYLSGNLIAQNLTDTIQVVSSLLPDSSYTGRVVAYLSASDSVSVNFSLPAFQTSPTDPYGHLRGYYKVTEQKTDFWTGGEIYNHIFTGRVEITQDTIANFLQLPRMPSTWWQFDFLNVKIRPYWNDSLYHYSNSSFNGRILNQNTIRTHYLFGGGATVFRIEQLWEKLQNPADSIAYAFQWPDNVPGMIKTIAGNNMTLTAPQPSGDGGDALQASLANPFVIYADPQLNFFIGDGTYSGSALRKINNNGIINLFAGDYSFGFSGDGGPATLAKMNLIRGVVTDAVGNVYISDGNNHVIRKVNSSGIITTIAGVPGQAGYSGDGGLATAAKLNIPDAIRVDAGGNLIFCEVGNDIIRKIDASGIISTIAGNGTFGYSGNGGPSTSAQLYNPNGLELDQAGNLYIADNSNNVIRKVNTGGIISTVAGTQFSGFSGDGGPATGAELNGPTSVAIDAAGNLYIGDVGNNRIRKVATNGIISTIAGTGSTTALQGANVQTFNGDYGPATGAVIRGPSDVFCRGSALYLVDGFSRLRKIFL